MYCPEINNPCGWMKNRRNLRSKFYGFFIMFKNKSKPIFKHYILYPKKTYRNEVLLRLILKKYIEINIYMNSVVNLQKLLTVEFNTKEATDLGGGGFELSQMKVPAKGDLSSQEKAFENNIKWLGMDYKKKWEDFAPLHKYCNENSRLYFITINMDPSKISYSDELEVQREYIIRLLDEYRHKIKFLILVYEYGMGKLHWHIVINTTAYRDFIKLAREIFGNKPATVYSKKVIPNRNETFRENLDKLILKYFNKEKHNLEKCLVSKNAFMINFDE